MVLISFVQFVADPYAPNLMTMFRSRDETIADLLGEYSTVEGVFVFGDSMVSASDCYPIYIHTAWIGRTAPAVDSLIGTPSLTISVSLSLSISSFFL